MLNYLIVQVYCIIFVKKKKRSFKYDHLTQRGFDFIILFTNYDRSDGAN